MIRPEQIRIGRNGLEAEPGVAATVVGHNYFGPDVIVYLELEDTPRTPVLARSFDYETPETGEHVRLAVAGPVAVYPAPTSSDLEVNLR